MYAVELKESYFPAQADGVLEELTIGDMLRRSVGAYGDAPALREVLANGDYGRAWTYAELLADCERLARALASRHDKGARIAVWANNVPEWILLELASAMAGLTLVTVNPSYQARELKYVLEQSRAEALYLVENVRGNPLAEIARQVCAGLPGVRRLILLTDHGALFAGAEQGVLPDVAPRDPAQIQYTSGTTGFPKGALLHHAGLVQNARDTIRRGGVGPGDAFVHYMPLFHTTGCAILALGGLGVGASMFLLPNFDAALAAAAIERERMKFVLGVPTMLFALMEEVERAGRDVSSVMRVMSGGSMVAPELVRKSERVLGSPIQIIYGQTEASPVITQTWADDAMEDLTTTIGQPLPHVEVSIRDPQTNEVLPVGAQGEICARGYLVMLGYNDNPEATAKAIDAEGWLHTGDLGRMDARGYVSITGRVKEMIIRGGENLFPAEIENAMLEHPDVAEVAVVGVPDEKWGEQVACFMRAKGEARPDPAALKKFIRERLSPQKTPVYWIWVEAWPLTGSGKIQKFRLAEAFIRGDYDVLTA
ncbi:AMP-binding protein [Amphiplicatus metriothermophilus]|uniref:Fatty-acyl-CoA synthase n=1 Tax=Amphiplicatus metriothermophilus TaxID=1519374 RepID=A0A239PY32_9PROT|nr:AMP-binding protein [Amphiplicatus metriothermophilus]MBB5519869.1 fatty-acyl-CoA synthase [Amphiplicatus metriothermophilus]SNT75080.1 fatty-acyl-CoA synthase [Amphiplicatus metriothermophilus]